MNKVKFLGIGPRFYSKLGVGVAGVLHYGLGCPQPAPSLLLLPHFNYVGTKTGSEGYRQDVWDMGHSHLL